MDSQNGAAKILVVDDVPENVRLMEAVLVPRGYQVVSASNGREALGVVEPEPRSHPPRRDDAGDGRLAVCTHLREHEETAVLPVIMVTSSIGQEKTRAIEAGADDFIRKPFDTAELLGPRPLAPAHQALPRHDQGAEPDPRAARPRPGRGAGAAPAPAAVPFAAARGRDRRLGQRSRPAQSPAAGDAVLFCDLRGYTNFADAVEPEELMRRPRRVPRRRSAGWSSVTRRRSASLQGDGVELFFNDPIEIPDAPLRSVQLCMLAARGDGRFARALAQARL